MLLVRVFVYLSNKGTYLSWYVQIVKDCVKWDAGPIRGRTCAQGHVEHVALDVTACLLVLTVIVRLVESAIRTWPLMEIGSSVLKSPMKPLQRITVIVPCYFSCLILRCTLYESYVYFKLDVYNINIKEFSFKFYLYNINIDEMSPRIWEHILICNESENTRTYTYS